MKVDDTDGEKEESDEKWSDEESAMREIVLALPALRISSERFGVSSAVAVEEASLNEQAVVEAELIMAAAEEAVMKERSDGKKKMKKKVSRPRKTMKTMKINDGASGSGKAVEAKNPKKKSSKSTSLPKGPPTCNICGRVFGSWKAVFGHLRSHKNRNYLGFHPPHKFSVAKTFTIPGPNSAFVPVTAGVGSSGGSVAASGGGGASGSEGGRGFDLNVDPVEEDDQKMNESGSVAKFDLNKPPPKDEEEEEDKAK
ncbi:unnamed protein product [Microthlaspi erraticum]|uniref:C2H2-type domain-containing protein n=1 Tax=Microthlaspi erraticum TaxID=1685480 RepID=A0A6D2J7V6_9BRAS|nr:unnamed protein product [Microthlaspi erraticum]